MYQQISKIIRTIFSNQKGMFSFEVKKLYHFRISSEKKKNKNKKAGKYQIEGD